MNIGNEVVYNLVSLLKRKIAFVAYSLPGQNAVNFIIDDNISPVTSSRKFIITTWEGLKINILDRISIDQAKSCPIHEELSAQFQRASTPWEEYNSTINQITQLLRTTEGKVVISRLKTIKDQRLDYPLIGKSMAEMFAMYPNTFRAIYFTPTTGAWCVCSPELLLKVDKVTGTFNTVALAGTRSGDVQGDWDDKNMREHNLVVRHIADTLNSLTITPVISPAETMNTGNIQHILTRIQGNINNTSINDIVDTLHPTPAISGYPVKWSKEIIDKVESHDRECYGGYIALDTDEQYLAHVNLRCFAFEPGSCCFWGGGGIMKDSSPVSEWNESGLKIESTMSFITKRLSK